MAWGRESGVLQRRRHDAADLCHGSARRCDRLRCPGRVGPSRTGRRRPPGRRSLPNSGEAAPQLAAAEATLRPFLTRLRASDIPVLAIHGNDDRAPAVARLREFAGAGLLTLLGRSPHQLPGRGGGMGLDLVGYPFVPPTPFRNKEHERRDLATDRYGAPWPILVSAPAPDDPLARPRTTTSTACQASRKTWRPSRRPTPRATSLRTRRRGACSTARTPSSTPAAAPSAPGSSPDGRCSRCTATSTRPRTCSGAGRIASGSRSASIPAQPSARRCRRSWPTPTRCQARYGTPFARAAVALEMTEGASRPPSWWRWLTPLVRGGWPPCSRR